MRKKAALCGFAVRPSPFARECVAAQDDEHSDWGPCDHVTAMAVVTDLHRAFLIPAPAHRGTRGCAMIATEGISHRIVFHFIVFAIVAREQACVNTYLI